MRVFGFVMSICLVFVHSPTIADEYPDPGIFEIIQNESEIRVLVYRGGLLGVFGHNHVISTSGITGRIELSEDPASSVVELTIPVASFEVDIETIRLEEGDAFKNRVSDEDKRGTQDNMLGAKLLNSTNFSDITVRSQSWVGELPDIRVKSKVTVTGRNNYLEFPSSVSVTDDRIVVTGNFVLTHQQIGLKPFTAVLGGLRVRDEMAIKFLITAGRVSN